MRRQFVTDLLARKSTPKGALRYAVDTALSDPSGFGRADSAQIAALGSLDLSKGDQWGPAIGHLLVERASDARLPLVLLAQVAASVESSMGVHTWRNARYAARERTYLSFLVSQGYTLSEIERHVVDGDAKPKVGHIRSRVAATDVTEVVQPEPAADEQTESDHPDDVA